MELVHGPVCRKGLLDSSVSFEFMHRAKPGRQPCTAALHIRTSVSVY